MAYTIPPVGGEGDSGHLAWAAAMRSAVLDMDARIKVLEGDVETYPLDGFNVPYRVHSLRKLLGTYNDAAIRVRRSSDNDELDIGFDQNGDLDEAALSSFVSSDSAFVSIWYDQTPSSRHLAQETFGAQPRIVDSGTIDKISGKPCIIFDGTDDHLLSIASGLFTSATATVALVLQALDNSRPNATIFSESRSSSNNGFWRAFRGSSANWNVQATDNSGTPMWASTSSGSNLLDLNHHQGIYIEADEIVNTWKDGIPAHENLAAPRALTNTPDRTCLGSHAGSSISNFYHGAIQELFAWTSDQSDNRVELSSIQSTYWGTP